MSLVGPNNSLGSPDYQLDSPILCMKPPTFSLRFVDTFLYATYNIVIITRYTHEGT